MSSKGLWYLSGFEEMGFKYRFVALVAKILLVTGLINENDARNYADKLFNAYLKELSYENGLRLKGVKTP